METVHGTSRPLADYPPNPTSFSQDFANFSMGPVPNGTDFMNDEGFCGATCILTMYPEISLPVIISGVVTFVLGILGNSLVIFSVCRNKCLRTGINFYLMSLATADLVVAALFVPVETTEFFLSEWQLGWIACKLVAFIHLQTRTFSALTLTAIAVERRHVITHPLKAKSSATAGRTRRVIAAVWVTSLLLSVPKLFGQRLIAQHVPFDEGVVYHCQLSWNSPTYHKMYAVYLMVVLFAAPVLGMMVSHSRAIFKLRGESEANGVILNGLHSSKSKGGKRASKAQVTRILVAVVVLHAVFWGPILTLNLTMKFDLIDPHSQAVYAMKLAFTQLSLLHSCVNPIAYAFISRNFRSGLHQAFRTLNRRRHEESASGSLSGHHLTDKPLQEVSTVSGSVFTMWLWQVSSQLQQRGATSNGGQTRL